MFEKVNPSHPDKIADRIAGAIVDLAYSRRSNPKVAVEVLLGHGVANIIIESSENFSIGEVASIVDRIVKNHVSINLVRVPQDKHLADNQKTLRCGDNGIFKGCLISREQGLLSALAREIYKKYPTDGKYLICDDEITVCQSSSDLEGIKELCSSVGGVLALYNPLGDWEGGISVDSGATNRKLGSDLGDAVTGGGIHGKDLSKADVTVNIYLHLLAERLGTTVEASCSIGDDYFTVYRSGTRVGIIKFSEAVKVVKQYIQDQVGGFEKLAEWGLI